MSTSSDTDYALSIATMDKISLTRYFWVLYYVAINHSVNEAFKHELSRQRNTFNLALIPYFMLNNCIINWQHIAEWYWSYLQVTPIPLSAYISSFCTFQCTGTGTASHTLYLKRTGRIVPSFLLYYVRVPVSWLTGSRVIVFFIFIVFAALFAALSADIA